MDRDLDVDWTLAVSDFSDLSQPLNSSAGVWYEDMPAVHFALVPELADPSRGQQGPAIPTRQPARVEVACPEPPLMISNWPHASVLRRVQTPSHRQAGNSLGTVEGDSKYNGVSASSGDGSHSSTGSESHRSLAAGSGSMSTGSKSAVHKRRRMSDAATTGPTEFYVEIQHYKLDQSTDPLAKGKCCYLQTCGSQCNNSAIRNISVFRDLVGDAAKLGRVQLCDTHELRANLANIELEGLPGLFQFKSNRKRIVPMEASQLPCPLARIIVTGNSLIKVEETVLLFSDLAGLVGQALFMVLWVRWGRDTCSAVLKNGEWDGVTLKFVVNKAQLENNGDLLELLSHLLPSTNLVINSSLVQAHDSRPVCHTCVTISRPADSADPREARRISLPIIDQIPYHCVRFVKGTAVPILQFVPSTIQMPQAVSLGCRDYIIAMPTFGEPIQRIIAKADGHLHLDAAVLGSLAHFLAAQDYRTRLVVEVKTVCDETSVSVLCCRVCFWCELDTAIASPDIFSAVVSNASTRASRLPDNRMPAATTAVPPDETVSSRSRAANWQHSASIVARSLFAPLNSRFSAAFARQLRDASLDKLRLPAPWHAFKKSGSEATVAVVPAGLQKLGKLFRMQGHLPIADLPVSAQLQEASVNTAQKPCCMSDVPQQHGEAVLLSVMKQLLLMVQPLHDSGVMHNRLRPDTIELRVEGADVTVSCKESPLYNGFRPLCTGWSLFLTESDEATNRLGPAADILAIAISLASMLCPEPFRSCGQWMCSSDELAMIESSHPFLAMLVGQMTSSDAQRLPSTAHLLDLLRCKAQIDVLPCEACRKHACWLVLQCDNPADRLNLSRVGCSLCSPLLAPKFAGWSRIELNHPRTLAGYSVDRWSTCYHGLATDVVACVMSEGLKPAGEYGLRGLIGRRNTICADFDAVFLSPSFPYSSLYCLPSVTQPALVIVEARVPLHLHVDAVSIQVLPETLGLDDRLQVDPTVPNSHLEWKVNNYCYIVPTAIWIWPFDPQGSHPFPELFENVCVKQRARA